MFWFFVAAICLTAAVICFIRCLVYRRKLTNSIKDAQPLESPADGITVTAVDGVSTEANAYKKKAKRQFYIGIILLVLTETAILIARYITT